MKILFLSSGVFCSNWPERVFVKDRGPYRGGVEDNDGVEGGYGARGLGALSCKRGYDG